MYRMVSQESPNTCFQHPFQHFQRGLWQTMGSTRDLACLYSLVDLASAFDRTYSQLADLWVLISVCLQKKTERKKTEDTITFDSLLIMIVNGDECHMWSIWSFSEYTAQQHSSNHIWNSVLATRQILRKGTRQIIQNETRYVYSLPRNFVFNEKIGTHRHLCNHQAHTRHELCNYKFCVPSLLLVSNTVTTNTIERRPYPPKITLSPDCDVAAILPTGKDTPPGEKYATSETSMLTKHCHQHQQ